MESQNAVQVYLKIEDETCKIGSQIDGQNFYDLINWEDDSPGYLLLCVVPRVGESIYIDSFWFEVTGIIHKIFTGSDIPFHGHTVSIRVKQIPLADPRTRW